MNPKSYDNRQTVTFYILGGAGDLVRRLLIPGMAGYLREYEGTRINIVGSGRSEIDDYPQLVRDSLTEADTEVDDAVVDSLAEHATYLVTDATDPAELQKLLDSREPGDRAVLYFALSPSVTAQAVDALAGVTLPEGIVLAMEKPFGEDADTARELNEKLWKITDEEHIFRIDHFNCETALSNLVGLMGANAIFSAGWNKEAIEKIEIIYDESLGLEGRAEFYDSNGAVRDMLQSHLLQVMAHALAAGTDDPVIDILAATDIEPDSIRRARYTEGEAGGERMPDYVQEEGVAPERRTETLFQVTAWVDTDRWSGVPVTLRSGKALGKPRKEIAISYRRQGFPEETQLQPGSRLLFPFTDEVVLEANVSDHGYNHNLQRVNLHTELVPSQLTAYGRVVRSILDLSEAAEVPADAPGRTWEIVEPVLAAFENDDVPLEEYPAGSEGPEGWI